MSIFWGNPHLHMRYILFFFFLLLLRPVSGQAPADMSAAFPVIDGLFKDFAAKNHYPGFVYGIVAGGKLVFTGSVGYTNPEKKIPATTLSDFRIASMTKSFVSVAILQLRRQIAS